ncbi:MAG: nitrite/sulfite reductase [Thermoleophilia bacterium]|nr:nitrite/sulfite reductase [Thermoleophilia bacterium]
MSSRADWRDRLNPQMEPGLAEEIDVFEAQLELRQQDRIDERVFAETRLRRGAYGQRYDNGLRHDGTGQKQLPYPAGRLTKGPETMWDAPGMLRIKLPYGGITPDQLDVIAESAEEHSDGILHITTRQDVQLHFVHLEDTVTVMRRIGAVGITTREACGNGVRNITGCPVAGVCHTEAFDVTPYADAMFRFLLGHPDCQDFGRKFKIAFSGCAGEACGLVMMHDFGAIAQVRDGVRGFSLWVGGGLGTTPQQAKLLYDWVPASDLLPVAQAVGRVFGRLGEKKNRNRARIKFLITKLGVDEFRGLVDAERAILPHDDRWTSFLPGAEAWADNPRKAPAPRDPSAELPEGYAEWARTNVQAQRQAGYSVATVALPLGDLTSEQARGLSDIARLHVGDNIRTTVEQNVVLRYVPDAELPALYQALAGIGLASAGAGTILDITACPGTDTCKLGISSSRGLAGELRTRLAAASYIGDASIEGLRIKVSGCFNSCGQHHVADIGFFGNNRKINGYSVPHFQVVLGGRWRENAGSYGMPVGAIPSKRIPEVVEKITTTFASERHEGETFQDWIARLGKKEIGVLLADLKAIPGYDEDRSFYVDWADAREYSVGDIGVGECAGEVISRTELFLTEAEGTAFDAQVALEDGDLARADDLSYRAMLQAAWALVRTEQFDASGDPDDVVREFKQRFYDTERFFDRFSGGKFARPLFVRHAEGAPSDPDAEQVRILADETQLFIDAVHQYEIRQAGATGASV